jgi:hypothetical protein
MLMRMAMHPHGHVPRGEILPPERTMKKARVSGLTG